MFQVGFVAKGIVYALIGGLSCQSAVHDTVTIRGADNSPQVPCELPLYGMLPTMLSFQNSAKAHELPIA